MSQTLTEENASIVTEPDQRPDYREPGDGEKFSHYADKDKIAEAYFTGTPVTALCGKTWVPTRDPEKFPVCPACKEAYEALPDDTGD